MHIKTLYDRTSLIDNNAPTTSPARRNRRYHSSHWCCWSCNDHSSPSSPPSPFPSPQLFAFGMMVLTGRSATLISIGAIDFGILVDSCSIIVLEEHLSKALRAASEANLFATCSSKASPRASRPVLLLHRHHSFVAFIPLFTMQGVAARSSPMSVTYALVALLRGLLSSSPSSSPPYSDT